MVGKGLGHRFITSSSSHFFKETNLEQYDWKALQYCFPINLLGTTKASGYSSLLKFFSILFLVELHKRVFDTTSNPVFLKAQIVTTLAKYVRRYSILN